MISAAFNFLLYNPLYNALIFFISVAPYASVGIAVILLTVVVKLVLFPLSLKAVKTQVLMRELEPELTKIKKQYEKDKQEQARRTMGLYKEKRINPFSGFLVILIQLPIIFALYFVFFRGGLPTVDLTLLYSFVIPPSMVNMEFLWVPDIAGRSVVLALFASVTQYFQINLAMPPLKPRDKNASLKDDLMRSFQLQMRYVMPLIVFGVAYFISAAIALYWTTSNLFAIAQEVFVLKKHREPKKT